MGLFTPLPIAASITIILLLAVFTRLIHILPGFTPRPKPKIFSGKLTSHLVLVLGSGGHTAEMFSLVRDLNPLRYKQRTYVVSSGDVFSAGKAIEFEEMLAERYKYRHCLPAIDGQGTTGESKTSAGGRYTICTVPRARKIHQSLLTAAFSSFSCLLSCMRLLRSSSPDLILTNGPATGVIVVLAALILRFFALETGGQMRCVYVESWARVKTLSLSGRILSLGLVDRLLVQWEGLSGGNREYNGTLVD